MKMATMSLICRMLVVGNSGSVKVMHSLLLKQLICIKYFPASLWYPENFSLFPLLENQVILLSPH